MNTYSVAGFTRPACLGGPPGGTDDILTIRWFGTTNFELEFHDTVILLDNFYDRGPRTPHVGFGSADVTRADLILIGHPHYDHIADTTTVAARTGARVLVHPIGADLLLEQGLPVAGIEPSSGLGEGDFFQFDGFSVRVLHAIHMQPDPQAANVRDTAAAWGDLPPLSAEEDTELKAIMGRGSWADAVFTEATLCYVIDIGDGFRVVFRDSAGPLSVEESGWFEAHPGSDLAIVSYAGRPVPRWQIDNLTLPLIEHYQPGLAMPCHHDELYPYFWDMPTEPLRRAVRSLPSGSDLMSPVYVEPVRIGMKDRSVNAGDQRPG
jgi:L-ascorbate metabolism protein UlaG (beta-lactamase superfamily)